MNAVLDINHGMVKKMSKLKIMISQPMKDKTRDEIELQQEKIANILFDHYGDGNIEILTTIVENHEKKSALECLSESIFFLSTCDILCMAEGWENARGCRIEHEIAKAYDKKIIYMKELLNPTEIEFMNLTVDILKEFLEYIPDEYSVVVEDFPNHTIPVMNFDTDDTSKEFILKPGDLNEE